MWELFTENACVRGVWAWLRGCNIYHHFGRVPGCMACVRVLMPACAGIQIHVRVFECMMIVCGLCARVWLSPVGIRCANLFMDDTGLAYTLSVEITDCFTNCVWYNILKTWNINWIGSSVDCVGVCFVWSACIRAQCIRIMEWMCGRKYMCNAFSKIIPELSALWIVTNKFQHASMGPDCPQLANKITSHVEPRCEEISFPSSR